jgi:hypothetical protein
MNHNEAKDQMAVERYLLDELTPELREAFEEHYFDCPECALDLRIGATLVDEVKTLPREAAAAAAPPPATPRPEAKKPKLFLWWRPVFAAPAFALLLAVIAYQNLDTLPTLEKEAAQPRLLPWTLLHAETRGGGPLALQADRTQGAVLLIDLPQDAANTSYAFDLYNAHGKRIWTETAGAVGEGRTVSILIPGPVLAEGSDMLAISGIAANGERTEIDRRSLDIHFAK